MGFLKPSDRVSQRWEISIMMRMFPANIPTAGLRMSIVKKREAEALVDPRPEDGCPLPHCVFMGAGCTAGLSSTFGLRILLLSRRMIFASGELLSTAVIAEST